MHEKDSFFYKKLFLDISNRCSPVEYSNKEVYIKHLCSEDYIKLNQKEKFYYDKALKRGLPTEKEALKKAINEGEWTQKDEDFLETQQSFIDNLHKSKSHLLLQSEKDRHQKTIDEETIKLNKKILEKDQVIKNTAEVYARKQNNDFYIFSSLYKNKSLTEALFSTEQFEELSYTDIGDLIIINNNHANDFSEENIQIMVLQDFFFPYMFLCEKPTELFGLPAISLTNFQLTTLLYARIFKNIFDHNSDIPDSIKKDPKALLDYSSSSKQREKAKEHLSKDGTSMVFGATEKDYESMGVDKSELSSGKTSLQEAARKKGGSLNMQDLMNLH